MQRAITLSVVALVVLAGCSGLPGVGDDSTPTEQSTATGAPTATATPTATPSPSEVLADEELPPGLTEERIDDPGALVAAHRENLQASGAVARLQSSLENDFTETSTNATVRIGSDGTLSVVQRTDTGFSNVTTRMYADGPQMYLNQTIPQRTVYSAFSSEYYRSLALPDANLEQYLTAANFTVSSVDRSGDATLVTLTADSANESAFADADGNVENVSGRLVVDLEGTIHSVSLHYEVTADDSTSTSDVEYALEEREVESVEEPAWVDTARERTVSADLEYTVEDGVVRIDHAGGDTIPAGTQITVTETAFVEGELDENESYTLFSAQLQEDFEAGDTAYVSQSDEESRTGNVTIGDRPDADVAALEETLLVQLVDGHTGETVDVTRVPVDEEDDS